MNKEKVPFRYIIDYKDHQSLHLLYQILIYLEIIGKLKDNEFSITDVNLHTTIKDSETKKAMPLIEDLIDKGYVEKIKSKYYIIKNPWK